MKLAHLSLKEKNSALNEVRILASIRSPLLLQYREAFFEEEGKVLCIVMEWASKNSTIQLRETSKN